MADTNCSAASGFFSAPRKEEGGLCGSGAYRFGCWARRPGWCWLTTLKFDHESGEIHRTCLASYPMDGHRHAPSLVREDCAFKPDPRQRNATHFKRRSGR